MEKLTLIHNELGIPSEMHEDFSVECTWILHRNLHKIMLCEQDLIMQRLLHIVHTYKLSYMHTMHHHVQIPENEFTAVAGHINILTYYIEDGLHHRECI